MCGSQETFFNLSTIKNNTNNKSISKNERGKNNERPKSRKSRSDWLSAPLLLCGWLAVLTTNIQLSLRPPLPPSFGQGHHHHPRLSCGLALQPVFGAEKAAHSRAETSLLSRLVKTSTDDKLEDDALRCGVVMCGRSVRNHRH